MHTLKDASVSRTTIAPSVSGGSPRIHSKAREASVVAVTTNPWERSSRSRAWARRSASRASDARTMHLRTRLSSKLIRRAEAGLLANECSYNPSCGLGAIWPQPGAAADHDCCMSARFATPDPGRPVFQALHGKLRLAGGVGRTVSAIREVLSSQPDVDPGCPAASFHCGVAVVYL